MSWRLFSCGIKEREQYLILFAHSQVFTLTLKPVLEPIAGITPYSEPTQIIFLGVSHTLLFFYSSALALDCQLTFLITFGNEKSPFASPVQYWGMAFRIPCILWAVLFILVSFQLWTHLSRYTHSSQGVYSVLTSIGVQIFCVFFFSILLHFWMWKLYKDCFLHIVIALLYRINLATWGAYF